MDIHISLPEEIFVRIISLLSNSDLFKVKSVSTNWLNTINKIENELINDNVLKALGSNERQLVVAKGCNYSKCIYNKNSVPTKIVFIDYVSGAGFLTNIVTYDLSMKDSIKLSRSCDVNACEYGSDFILLGILGCDVIDFNRNRIFSIDSISIVRTNNDYIFEFDESLSIYNSYGNKINDHKISFTYPSVTFCNPYYIISSRDIYVILDSDFNFVKMIPKSQHEHLIYYCENYSITSTYGSTELEIKRSDGVLLHKIQTDGCEYNLYVIRNRIYMLLHKKIKIYDANTFMIVDTIDYEYEVKYMDENLLIFTDNLNTVMNFL